MYTKVLFLVILFFISTSCISDLVEIETPVVTDDKLVMRNNSELTAIPSVTGDSQILITSPEPSETPSLQPTNTILPTNTSTLPPVPTPTPVNYLETPIIILRSDGRFSAISLDGLIETTFPRFPRVPRANLEDVLPFALRSRFTLSPNSKFATYIDGSTLNVYSFEKGNMQFNIRNIRRVFGWANNSEIFAFSLQSDLRQVCFGNVTNNETSCSGSFNGDIVEVSISPINPEVAIVFESSGLLNNQGLPVNNIHYLDLDTDQVTFLAQHTTNFEFITTSEFINWTSEGVVIRGTEASINEYLFFELEGNNQKILSEGVLSSDSNNFIVESNRILTTLREDRPPIKLQECQSREDKEIFAWDEAYLAHYLKCEGNDFGFISIISLLDSQTVLVEQLPHSVAHLDWFNEYVIFSTTNNVFEDNMIYSLSLDNEIKLIADGVLLIDAFDN